MNGQDVLRLARTERLEIPRLVGPIVLDGRLDEAAWASARLFPLIQQSPEFGAPASERSEALIAFDDAAVYVAARLHSVDPSRIQAPTRKRDALNGSADAFGVLLDTFCDKESGLVFLTTPSGLRFDATVYRDAQMSSPTDFPMNMSWNAFWDVAVGRNAEGWLVEMRIPVSSLRFQEVDGRTVMGAIFFRWQAARNETDIFPAIPPNWGEMSLWKPSQAQEVELPGLHSRHPLYIAPYILGGAVRAVELDDVETAYIGSRSPRFEIGLDVKYGLTNNLTLDATLNTDFAQVEADDAQVNLTRYSLFFPEKRLFFQERASVFDFRMGSTDSLFYSRRIGLNDGRAVPIYGGGRLVGRIGSWDVGILDMQTAPSEDLPSENFGVLRLRRRVFNANSYLGGMLTSRLGSDGSSNVAYGLDGIIRLRGEDYLTFDWAQTFKDGAANRPLSFDPTRLGLMYERRTQKGFAFRAGALREGRDFDPGMGFVLRPNISRLSGALLYGWFPGAGSALYSHGLSLEGAAVWENDRALWESVEIGPSWRFATKSGWGGTFGPMAYFEDVPEAFELSNAAEIPAGRYAFAGLKGIFQSPQGRLLSGMLTVEAGSFYDGWRASVGIMPLCNLVSDLEVGGLLQYNRVSFPGRGQSFLAPVGQLRVLATMSTAVSILGLVQYNGDDDSVTANLRFRYNPREGTDIYLVYNEGLNTDRLARVPVPPVSAGRALLLKLNYTFDF